MDGWIGGMRGGPVWDKEIFVEEGDRSESKSVWIKVCKCVYSRVS